MKFDHEATTKELIEFAKPHWAAASAIVAVLAAAASTYAQQKAAAKARAASRRAQNDALLAGGSTQSIWEPTAKKFQEGSGGGGSKGIGDALKTASASPAGQASPQQQGFSLGVKSLEQPTPEVKEFGAEGMVSDPNAALPMEQITDTSKLDQPVQSSQAPSAASQAGSYAQLAASLYDAYSASKQGPPQGAQIPRLGQMNLQPTASRFGIRR